MNKRRMTALFVAVAVALLTACSTSPPASDSSTDEGPYVDENPYAGGDAHYEADENPYGDGDACYGEEPGPSPESEWGPVDVEPDMSAVQPDWDTGEPVEDEIHIRVEGDTIYFSGTGTVRAEDYGSYDPINVVIEEGITGIGKSAFQYCHNLQSVNLPASLRAIGDSAFHKCDGLTSIALPDSIERIGENAFAECTRLSSVLLPSGLKEIQKGAFVGCMNLASINLPNSLTVLGVSAFRACLSLPSVTIPDGVEELPGESSGGVFFGCSSLTSVTIGSGVKTIGRDTFAYSGLTSVIIPDSVEKIETEAFQGCSDLTEVVFGTGVASIDPYLAECPLARVKAPTSLQELIIKSGIDLSIVEWY